MSKLIDIIEQLREEKSAAKIQRLQEQAIQLIEDDKDGSLINAVQLKKVKGQNSFTSEIVALPLLAGYANQELEKANNPAYLALNTIGEKLLSHHKINVRLPLRRTDDKTGQTIFEYPALHRAVGNAKLVTALLRHRDTIPTAIATVSIVGFMDTASRTPLNFQKDISEEVKELLVKAKEQSSSFERTHKTAEGYRDGESVEKNLSLAAHLFQTSYLLHPASSPNHNMRFLESIVTLSSPTAEKSDVKKDDKTAPLSHTLSSSTDFGARKDDKEPAASSSFPPAKTDAKDTKPNPALYVAKLALGTLHLIDPPEKSCSYAEGLKYFKDAKDLQENPSEDAKQFFQIIAKFPEDEKGALKGDGLEILNELYALATPKKASDEKKSTPRDEMIQDAALAALELFNKLALSKTSRTLLQSALAGAYLRTDTAASKLFLRADFYRREIKSLDSKNELIPLLQKYFNEDKPLQAFALANKLLTPWMNSEWSVLEEKLQKAKLEEKESLAYALRLQAQAAAKLDQETKSYQPREKTNYKNAVRVYFSMFQELNNLNSSDQLTLAEISLLDTIQNVFKSHLNDEKVDDKLNNIKETVSAFQERYRLYTVLQANIATFEKDLKTFEKNSKQESKDAEKLVGILQRIKDEAILLRDKKGCEILKPIYEKIYQQYDTHFQKLYHTMHVLKYGEDHQRLNKSFEDLRAAKMTMTAADISDHLTKYEKLLEDIDRTLWPHLSIINRFPKEEELQHKKDYIALLTKCKNALEDLLNAIPESTPPCPNRAKLLKVIQLAEEKAYFRPNLSPI